jgi:hypothetical protein
MADHAPVELATIKDDLGIAAGDASNDAWLQRRVNGVWARFQQYTGRPLSLSSGWADDWGKLVPTGVTLTQPPAARQWPSGSVFLRVFPVQTITKLVLDGADQDVARLLFDGASGKLVGLDGHPYDLRHLLLAGRARVEYTAGFAELPADLYEALLGCVQVLWQSRQSQQAGLGSGNATRISAIDVGDVELSDANAFVLGAIKGAGATDPLLGPFASQLDTYIDWRSMLGGPLPSTDALPPPGP